MKANNLTSQDIDEVWSNYKQALTELTSFEQQTTVKKKDIIIRLRDSVEVLVEAGKIPIKRNEISSYVRARLTEYGITYSPGHWHELFLPEQKLERTNISSPYGDHQHSFEQESNPSNCLCGALQYNGLIYELEQVKEEKELNPNSLGLSINSETPDPYSNPVTEYYDRVSNNAKELSSIAESIIKKYYEDEETAKLIESSLAGINNAIKEQKSLEAELISLAKQMDYRIRVGHFEKIKALLFEKCTKYGIAGVAGLMSPPCIKCGHKGITPKHVSANLMRKDRDKILNKMMWFRTIDFEVGNKRVVIDINDWFNKQVERAELNLDIENPILVSYVAE